MVSISHEALEAGDAHEVVGRHIRHVFCNRVPSEDRTPSPHLVIGETIGDRSAHTDQQLSGRKGVGNV
jgi:hypothetical protein